MPGENKLLVIGIDEYDGVDHKRLNNAVRDAKRFAQILTDRYGFIHEGRPLYNEKATTINIHEAFTNLVTVLGPEDTVVIYLQVMVIIIQ